MKANKQILEDIHQAVAKALLDKIQSGEATAADLQAARGFLRDNNISAIPTANNNLGLLLEELPFEDDEYMN